MNIAEYLGLAGSPNLGAFDNADNGTVSSGPGGTTYTPPSWLTTLQGLASAGATVYGAINPAGNTNAQGTAQTQAVIPPAGQGQAQNPTGAGITSIPWLTISLIAGAIVAIWLLVRK